MNNFEKPISDARLVRDVARAIQLPREPAANSFVLHAPLELAARSALLPMIRPSARGAAHERIRSMVDEWQAFGPPMEPAAPREYESLAAAANELNVAIGAGDMDLADTAAQFLGVHAQPDQLQQLLATSVLPSLAAAAHGSIFLYLLPRVAPRGDGSTAMIRPLARELARGVGLQLTWVANRHSASSRHSGPSGKPSLLTAIAGAPRLGYPGSNFIFPIMHQAEHAGNAAEVLTDAVAGSSLTTAATTLLRIAAWSMLQEGPDEARYGWSHCLTMTQGALGVARSCADPSDAVAVAATYVYGFRAALAQNDLRSGYAPERPTIHFEREAMGAPPDVAAAVMFHASDTQREELIEECVTRAAVHEDAHLVKYTLACLDAAAFDRQQSALYLSAMAHLNALWHQ